MAFSTKSEKKSKFDLQTSCLDYLTDAEWLEKLDCQMELSNFSSFHLSTHPLVAGGKLYLLILQFLKSMYN